MKQVSKIWYGSLVSAMLLFGGCGTGSDTAKAENELPHDGSKSFRALSQDRDWTWNVDMRFSVTDPTKEPYALNKIVIECFDGIPENVKHLQFFINTDNNASTGFTGSDGWHVIGADYLIEDGKLFKSQSTTAWKWKSLGRIKSYQKLADDDSYAKIIMKFKKQIPVAPRMDMSIEPYNGKWNGVYDTVYPLNSVAENIAFTDETLQAVFKNLLGDDFITIDETEVDNRVVVTQKLDGYKAYVLYDTSDMQQPQELALIAKSDTASTVKALEVLDAQKLSYILSHEGKNYRVVYDYVALQELSRTAIPVLTPESLTEQLTAMDKLDTSTESFVYVTSDTEPRYVIVAVYAVGDMHDVKRYLLLRLSDSGVVSYEKDLNGINVNADITTLHIVNDHIVEYKEFASDAHTAPKVHRYDFIEGKEVGDVSVELIDKVKSQFLHPHEVFEKYWFSPNQKYIVIQTGTAHLRHLKIINVEDQDHLYLVKEIYDRPYSFALSDVTVDDQYVSYIQSRRVNDTTTRTYLKFTISDGEQVEKQTL